MFPDFLDQNADVVARRLLGAELVRTFADGGEVRIRIVETESYDEGDAASHSYRGETPRTRIMFGASGYAYVYFTYGMHYCMNVVCEPQGRGAAVLLRAGEPLSGIERMEILRGRAGVELTNGPAKLCQALAITGDLLGHDLRMAPLRLERTITIPDSEITTTTRIGITKAADALRRWYITGNPYVSKP